MSGKNTEQYKIVKYMLAFKSYLGIMRVSYLKSREKDILLKSKLSCNHDEHIEGH